jgi:hypothetical protein
VKPVRACILFILLGQAIAVPVAAFSGTNPVRRPPHGNSIKKYMKQQQKEEKKARKFQTRAEKHWKQIHHAGH